MQPHYSKALAAGAWASAMLALGIVTHPASALGLTLLSLSTVIPPALLWHFAKTESQQSLSESIQKELR